MDADFALVGAAGVRGVLARVAADPSLVPALVEESLRYDGPVQQLTRRVTREVTLHGRTLAAGDEVQLLVGSANRCDVQLPSGPGALLELERSGESVSLKRLPLWPFPRAHVDGRPVRRGFLGHDDVISVADFELKISLKS